jgi:CheY-like chemotaxis protein
MGFDTCWAADGPAALAFVENEPKLALVMSDIVMPGGVSGLDLARTLRDRRPELLVILTTGYSSHTSEVLCGESDHFWETNGTRLRFICAPFH